MRRARLTLGYDGTDFVGSQAQPGQRTVQGVLDEAIARIAPGSGSTAFAGRTDRGVHALGQVVSVDLTWNDDANRCRYALNAVLPRDLVVSAVEWMRPAFHARFDAAWREYRYRILVAPAPSVFERRYTWWRRRDVDQDLAAAAAARLVGTNQFGSFAGSGKSQSLDPQKLTRTVRRSEWLAECAGAIVRHEFRIEATGFLPRMVRNITAALVEVGAERRPVEWIDELLAANDRRALGEAAPPEGLTLWRVRYDGEEDADDSTAGSAQHGEYGKI